MIISARRDSFPKSNVHLGRFERGTTNVGTLRPVAFFPIVPADDVFFSAHGLLRALPIKLPFLAGFDIRLDAFFVPYRLYNKSLRDNNVSTFDPSNIVFPQLSFASIAGTPAPTLPQSLAPDGSYGFDSIAGYANRSAGVSYYRTPAVAATSSSFPFVSSGSLAQAAGFPVGFMNGNRMTTDGSYPARLNFSALRFLSYIDVFRNYYANLQLDNVYFACSSMYTSNNSGTDSDKQPQLRGYTMHYSVPCKELDTVIEEAYNFAPTAISNPTYNMPTDEFIVSYSDLSLRAGGNTRFSPFFITENYCTRDGMLFLRSLAPFYQESWINKSKYDSGPGSISVQVEDNQVLLTSIRSGSKILKYSELSVAGGYRYDDFLSVQFDVRTQADTTVPVFLGSCQGSLSSDPLYQLAPGESGTSGIGSGLGAIGGTAMGTFAYSPRRWSFHEFGDIMVLLSLIPKVSYFATLDAFLEKTTLNTLYYPSLDRLGFQTLMHRNAVSPYLFNVYNAGTLTEPNYQGSFYSGDFSEAEAPLNSFEDFYDRGLGYQPAYSEYTIGVSRVTGDLATTLRPWSLTRAPGMDASGLLTKPTPVEKSTVSAGYDRIMSELMTLTYVPGQSIDAMYSGSNENTVYSHDTYIHPEDYNYLFEDVSPDAHNFIYEISFQCDIRREKSKLNMPTFGL